jgi:tripartite-type tricarboxylate transporter receptor subunit TctC
MKFLTSSLSPLLRGRAVLACATLAFSAFSHAQTDYPKAPIKIVVPAVPGGSADAIARIIAEELAPALGQPVLVDNRPGAGMVIGLTAVEQAPGDGYTIGIGPRGPIVIGPTVPGGLPFDPRERLQPIAKIAGVPIVFVANASTGIKSVAELIEKSKANPAGLNFGSPGQYTSHRIAVELVGVKTAARFTHVPYKGAGQSIVDVLGGQIPFAALDLTAVEQHIAAGKLNALAVTSRQRATLAPAIPTLIEQGQAIDVDSWLGVFAPKGTPKAVVDRLSGALEAAFKRPDTQQKLRRVGLEPDFENADRFSRTVDSDIKAWRELRPQALPELQK